MNRAMLPLLTLLLCACGKSYDTVLTERRAEIEPKLAQIEKLGRDSLTYYETLKDIALPQGGSLRFGDDPNAVLVQPEMFESDSEKRRPRLDLLIDNSWYAETRKALSGSSEKTDGADLEARFNHVAAIEYLVVVRTRIMAEPSAAGDGMFSPGLWQGEVMVFEVSSGNFLGGAPISAGNSDEVDVNVADAEKFLHKDLLSNTRAKIREALAPHSQDVPLS